MTSRLQKGYWENYETIVKATCSNYNNFHWYFSQTITHHLMQDRQPKEIKILDIGTGIGDAIAYLMDSADFSINMRGRGIKVVTVDKSAMMIEKAKRNRRLERFLDNITFVNQDALEFMKQNTEERYDVVQSTWTLHNNHFGYRDKLTDHMIFALRPNGLFINADKYAKKETYNHFMALREYINSARKNLDKELASYYIAHTLKDNRPEFLMTEGETISHLRHVSYMTPEIVYRGGMESIIAAVKPF